MGGRLIPRGDILQNLTSKQKTYYREALNRVRGLNRTFMVVAAAGIIGCNVFTIVK